MVEVVIHFTETIQAGKDNMWIQTYWLLREDSEEGTLYILTKELSRSSKLKVKHK